MHFRQNEHLKMIKYLMPTLSMCFEIKIYRTSKHDELQIIQKNLIGKTN